VVNQDYPKSMLPSISGRKNRMLSNVLDAADAKIEAEEQRLAEIARGEHISPWLDGALPPRDA
jgi:hypothetical protein